MCHRPRFYEAFVTCAMMVCAEPVIAGDGIRQQTDIGRAKLSDALTEFARETGTEILYEPRIVVGRMAPPVRGMLSEREGLSKLLAGSGIGFRRRGRSFVLFRLPPPKAANAPAGKRSGAEEVALPEIIVTGIRSHNADIRRTENDIQPYKVFGTGEILSAGRDNIEQVIRSREMSNTYVEIPSGLAAPADTQSSIDLRGLGTSRTLVLVDGRRLPSIPSKRFDVEQANLNGIPLSAIERIESLTGTAGGIYGPGALGGVVNVILKRNHDGISLRTTSGLTSRGDAWTIGLEGSFGLTSRNRRTRIMVAGGIHTANPLRQGDRDFAARQRSLQFRNDPEGYLGQRLEPINAVRLFPNSNVLAVRSLTGEELTLDSKFGGEKLGFSYTFLPTGLSGTMASNIALLKENAGQLDLSLPDDFSGTRRYLLPRSSTKSVIASVRQKLGDGIDVYIDGLFLQSEGRYDGAGQEGVSVLLPDAPTNPFTQRIFVSFPGTSNPARFEQKLRTYRLTTGVVFRLPAGWRGSGDYSIAASDVTRVKTLNVLRGEVVQAFAYGEPVGDSYPVLDPLGSWNQFVSAIELYREPSVQVQPLKNEFKSGNLRVGGPLVSLGGGPLTGTVQIERRRERVPEGEEIFRFPLNDSPFDFVRTPINRRRQSVDSAYMELRAPFTSSEQPSFVLRDLTLQAALRYDRSKAFFPETFRSAIDPSNYPVRSERTALTYTVGGKISPSPKLTIRGSVATGELPPTIASLDYSIAAFRGVKPELADPRRGNRPVGSEDFVEYLYGGLPESRPERASNMSLGAILNLSGTGGPRISIDYSTITVKREPYRRIPGLFDEDEALAQVPSALAAESTNPDRVIRAPLTNEDRTLGFTGGVVSRIDGRGFNEGRSRLQIVELQLDWLLRTGKIGDFVVQGSATWQPSFKRRASAERPWVQAAGQADGPLDLRAQFGVDWSIGPSTFGLNAQYFSRHRPTRSSAPPAYNRQIDLYHAGQRIREQVYLDLTARHRFNLFGSADNPRAVVVQIGVINLADSSPPIAADPQTRGYSYHADPRRRRLHFAISSDF